MLTRLRTLLHHLNHAKMSTASGTIHNTNVACCTIPPVVSKYVPKGIYKENYGGFDKVYVTGPSMLGDKALVCVYDIFGFKPQTQQGADIVADELKVQVYMPDFFEKGEPWPVDQFPPKTDEEKQKLQDFFGGIANPKENSAKLVAFGETLKKDGAKFVGTFGFCWGGKVIMLAGQGDTPFDAISIVHPAMLSSEDAPNLNVPLGLFPSLDEPEDEFKKIVEIMSKKPFSNKCDSHIFPSFHGFAAARANLDDEENNKQFVALYERLIKFFQTNSSGSSA